MYHATFNMLENKTLIITKYSAVPLLIINFYLNLINHMFSKVTRHLSFAEHSQEERDPGEEPSPS